jgi:hypothetical protein
MSSAAVPTTAEVTPVVATVFLFFRGLLSYRAVPLLLWVVDCIVFGASNECCRIVVPVVPCWFLPSFILFEQVSTAATAALKKDIAVFVSMMISTTYRYILYGTYTVVGVLLVIRLYCKACDDPFQFFGLIAVIVFFDLGRQHVK